MNDTEFRSVARPRLLYVGFNRTYVNRTFSVLMRSAHAHHDIDYFGPGYKSEEVVAAGLERWIDSNGPYDLVLFDHYLIMHDQISQRKKPFASDLLHFPIQAFSRFAPTLKEFVTRYRGKKCFIANLDVYGIKESETAELEHMDAFIIDSSMWSRTIQEKQETFGDTIEDEVSRAGFIAGRSTDSWVAFLKRNRTRIIQLPHAIGMDQFSFAPLETRKNVLCIPGTSYSERAKLYHLLSHSQRLRRLAYKVQDRISATLTSSLSSKRLLNTHYRYDTEIASSKLAFTSGSIFRSPVRKYFEIPALGALPIGQVVEGFEELGFTDGENFIIAESAVEIKSILSSFSDSSYQSIATAAQQLILRAHSEPARAQQLAMSIRRILTGRFKGSFWHKGCYLHFGDSGSGD